MRLEDIEWPALLLFFIQYRRKKQVIWAGLSEDAWTALLFGNEDSQRKDEKEDSPRQA